MSFLESSNPLIDAHKHSSSHREEIMTSESCGCFNCLDIFKPSEIVEWVDELGDVGITAVCPHCGVDSVIGTSSGYPVTPEFLGAMKQHWF